MEDTASIVHRISTKEAAEVGPALRAALQRQMTQSNRGDAFNSFIGSNS